MVVGKLKLEELRVATASTMGNRLCKKKSSDPVVTEAKAHPFDRLINRLHLRPTSWKSDPQLSDKQINRNEVSNKKSKNGIVQHPRPLSNAKSSDWTEASLEVPEKEEVIHLKNPQLSLIFNDNTTPTPPPRKHKKSLREKLESVAKNGLHALQTKKVVPLQNEASQESPKPVEEPPCIKKTVIYGCPLDDQDHAHHNRNHKHVPKEVQVEADNPQFNKDVKRKKNLSVVSLPNINEFRFSVKKEDLKRTDSGSNLIGDSTGKPKKTASTGKLEMYMRRCRSIGSLFPQRMKHKKSKALHDAESDDSFGGLEDWDCKILEHYKPKDASLQRPKRPVSEDKVIVDIEQLIVPQEEFEQGNPPVRPIRRSESLVKRESVTSDESSAQPSTKASSEDPITKKGVDENVMQNKAEMSEEGSLIQKEEPLIQNEEREEETRSDPQVQKLVINKETEDMTRNEGKTPPSTPVIWESKRESVISISKLAIKDEAGNVEHSPLMKILHEISKKEAEEKILQENNEINEAKRGNDIDSGVKEINKDVEEVESNLSSIDSMTPSLLEIEKAISNDRSHLNAVEEFLDAERRSNAPLIGKPLLEGLNEAKCQMVS